MSLTLEGISQYAFLRSKKLIINCDDFSVKEKDLKAECFAECWLAMQEGVEPQLVAKQVANTVRSKNVFRKRIPANHLVSPVVNPQAELERQLDAEAYLQVIRDSLRPDELALLEAREVHKVPFDELAKQQLKAKGCEITELSHARECARLRKVVIRLRARCARLISDVYPYAAEDIACWN